MDITELIGILSQPGSCVMVNVEGHQGLDYFTNGRALFYHSALGAADSARLRNMEQKFGIVPSPKYDENQERYYTNLSQYTFALNIPTTAEDPERTGAVIDYLAFLSYNDIIPILQESLCYKGLRDDDSIETMNLILNTEVLDIGIATNLTAEIFKKIGNDLVTGKLNFVSTVETQSKSINKKIEKLFAQ